MAFKFYDLGPRGFVIHDPKRTATSKFRYSLESDWRSRQISEPSQKLQALANGNSVPIALFGPQQVFVNLDALVTLEPGKQSPGYASATEGSESDQIVLCEGQKFFSIPFSPDDPPDGDDGLIPDGFEHDAGVLVNRGTVLAAIPAATIPVGTWCVLVNLAQLVR